MLIIVLRWCSVVRSYGRDVFRSLLSFHCTESDKGWMLSARETLSLSSFKLMSDITSSQDQEPLIISTMIISNENTSGTTNNVSNVKWATRDITILLTIIHFLLAFLLNIDLLFQVLCFLAISC